MSKQNVEKMEYDFTVASDIFVSAGVIKENTQITVKDTGWSEEEKERMRAHGYDSLDIVRAWYS